MSLNQEIPVVFDCEGSQLVGIAHLPEGPACAGVMLVVGGPQYRVGSHRMYVEMSRYLVAQGVAVFRFDYRSMGDSEGDVRCFENIEEDIRCAADEFFRLAPDMQSLSLLGLCDAASAICCYAWNDSRVDKLVLLNPWVTTHEGRSRVMFSHYYLTRIRSMQFWRKLFSFRINLLHSLRTLLGHLRSSVRLFGKAPQLPVNDLQHQMLTGLQRFDGDVQIILSGRDLIANEFQTTILSSPEWQQLVSRGKMEVVDFEEADHTFSVQEWRTRMKASISQWIMGA